MHIQRLGHFTIIGGPTVDGPYLIFPAQQERTGLTVRIRARRLPAADGEEAEAAQRAEEEAFLTTARTAASLRHTHLAPPVGSGAERTADGLWLYVVTLPFPGPTLADPAAAGTRTTVAEAVSAASAVLDGLSVIHAAGLSHGGIGPGLVSVTGTRAMLDGLSLALAPRAAASIGGDLDAVAALIRRMLSGPGSTRTGIPDDLAAVLDRAATFPTAAAFAQALAATLPAEPVPEPAPGRRAPLLAAAAVAALLAAGTGWYLASQPETPPALPPPPPPVQRVPPPAVTAPAPAPVPVPAVPPEPAPVPPPPAPPPAPPEPPPPPPAPAPPEPAAPPAAAPPQPVEAPPPEEPPPAPVGLPSESLPPPPAAETAPVPEPIPAPPPPAPSPAPEPAPIPEPALEPPAAAPEPPPPPPAAVPEPPPPPPAPAEPPPPPPSPDEARARLAGALDADVCGLMSVTVAGDTLTVGGTVAGDEERTRVQDLLNALPPPLRGVADLTVAAASLCPPLQAIAPFRLPAGTPAPALQSTAEAFAGGEDLLLALTAPKAPAHIQVDYFTIDGMVVHMLPNPLEPTVKMAAGDQRRLGERRDNSRYWEVAPPYGRELVVLLASPAPLFPIPRKAETESADSYLTALREALAGTPGTIAVPLFITTRAP